MTRYVAITFDDGPSRYTMDILGILRKYDIRATFFVVGAEAEKFPDLIRKMHAEGHVIGNHTWDHERVAFLSSKEIKHQVGSTNSCIERLTGKRPVLFRPPEGVINEKARSIIEGAGLTNVQWNVDGWDWDLNDETPLHERILPELLQTEKGILLLHDGDQYGCGPREQVIESLPILIKRLLQSHFRFCTVPEMLDMGFYVDGNNYPGQENYRRIGGKLEWW